LPYYGWDNEFGTHSAQVKGFKISDKLISNAQFLEFVLDHGYENKDLWSEEGWRWASGSKSRWPKFWVNRSETQNIEPSNFTLRLTLSETESLPWDFPVEINCFEASAYCRWLSRKHSKAIRLPTEDEFYATL
jgi:formylglycine-generating enzyme required for sulfatase activity